MTSTDIPRLSGLDHSIAFLREGYEFVSRRCDRLGTDAFHTRLMLTPVTCMRGPAAAEIFYGGERFTRRGAMPQNALRLLQDKGSVQQLDGPAHRHRKALFVDLLMGDDAEAAFLEAFRAEWSQAVDEWAQRDQMVLFDEANLALTRAVCRWAGVPLDRKGDREMAHELSSMIENAGGIGFRAAAALLKRRKAERFIGALVERIRTGRSKVPDTAPVARIARFVDSDGDRLSRESAAVEVLNVLRPTVAIGRYVLFAAMALKDHPEWRERLRGAGDPRYERFVEEVRRLYPYFPVIGGIAREALSWRGHRFAAGDWVLLDLHGTNHDPRQFPDPYAFDPERGLSWRDQGYAFIPQGAGPIGDTHRCPGERLTVAALREATRSLVEEMVYEVPEQDWSMPLGRMPARPRSGMILFNVRREGPRTR